MGGERICGTLWSQEGMRNLPPQHAPVPGRGKDPEVVVGAGEGNRERGAGRRDPGRGAQKGSPEGEPLRRAPKVRGMALDGPGRGPGLGRREEREGRWYVCVRGRAGHLAERGCGGQWRIAGPWAWGEWRGGMASVRSRERRGQEALGRGCGGRWGSWALAHCDPEESRVERTTTPASAGREALTQGGGGGREGERASATAGGGSGGQRSRGALCPVGVRLSPLGVGEGLIQRCGCGCDGGAGPTVGAPGAPAFLFFLPANSRSPYASRSFIYRNRICKRISKRMPRNTTRRGTGIIDELGW